MTGVWGPGRGGGVDTPRARAVLESDAYRRSPINHMLDNALATYGHRLDTGEGLPFSVLEEIRDEGMVDYAAALVRYNPTAQGDGALEGVFFSCATDEPDGFDEGELRQVVELLTHFAVAIKSRLTYEVARTVTETYLGADAGKRVLTGEISRGSIETIDAVIWFCDLRGFTELSDRLARDDLVALLNGYLDVMAGPLNRSNGQILKFLGDGFLATFDLTGRDAATVCGDALEAAIALRSEFDAFNGARKEAGEPTLGLGLALHIGEVFYGNIGTEDRLDFTVVGPAVNEASRIQDLCRPLGRDLLVSNAFRAILPATDHRLISVGRHALRGVPRDQELFTLG